MPPRGLRCGPAARHPAGLRSGRRLGGGSWASSSPAATASPRMRSDRRWSRSGCGGTFYSRRTGTIPGSRIARVLPSRRAPRAAAPATVRASSGPESCVCPSLPCFSRRRAYRTRATMTTSKIVLATRSRPSFANDNEIDFAPGKNEGGEAPKGACQPLPRHTDKPCRSPMPGRGSAPKAGARSPSGATPRHSPRLLPLGSAPGRASWNYRVQTGGPSPAPVQRAPRGPVVVPVGRFPKPPGSGVCRSARGHRSRSAFQEHPRERRPSDERDLPNVTATGTTVKGVVTIYVTSAFGVVSQFEMSP